MRDCGHAGVLVGLCLLYKSNRLVRMLCCAYTGPRGGASYSTFLDTR